MEGIRVRPGSLSPPPAQIRPDVDPGQPQPRPPGTSLGAGMDHRSQARSSLAGLWEPGDWPWYHWAGADGSRDSQVCGDSQGNDNVKCKCSLSR